MIFLSATIIFSITSTSAMSLVRSIELSTSSIFSVDSNLNTSFAFINWESIRFFNCFYSINLFKGIDFFICLKPVIFFSAEITAPHQNKPRTTIPKSFFISNFGFQYFYNRILNFLI